MNEKKFIKTDNRGIVKKLSSKGIPPCCMDNYGGYYYLNERGTLVILDDNEKNQLMYTDVLMG